MVEKQTQVRALVRGVALIALTTYGCKLGDRASADVTPDAASSAAAAAPAPPPPPPQKTLGDKVNEAQTLPDVLALLGPKFQDAKDDTDPAALVLAVWANQHMTWADVAVTKDETSAALAKKDIDSARGKRMCVTGRLVQIEVEKLPEGRAR